MSSDSPSNFQQVNFRSTDTCQIDLAKSNLKSPRSIPSQTNVTLLEQSQSLEHASDTLANDAFADVRGGAIEATGGRAWSTWSQSLQSVLDQPTTALPGRMILAGLIFCGAFAAWTWFGQVQEVSHAVGQLTPQGKVYKVQAVSQGEIVRLLVKPGQHVHSGQLIAELDSRLAEAEVNRLQQSLTIYKLQFLQTQELLNRTILEAQSRRAIAAAQINAQEAALAKAEANTETQRAMLTQIQFDRDAFNTRLERLKPLLAEGVIAQEQIFEVEQGLRDRQRALTQNQGELESALADAKRYQAEVTQQRAEARRSELETEQRLQQLKLEITELEAKINETENLLKAAETQLKKLLIYAPTDGTVSMLHIDNIGEVVRLGDTVAEIAPDGAPLVLSAVLPNQEAGLVRTDMPVQLKFDAFPYQEYGIVNGRVLSISPDAEQDEQLGAVYRVDISLDRKTSSQQRMQFKAGQTAKAEIVVRQRRILDVLLKPFQTLQQDSLKL